MLEEVRRRAGRFGLDIVMVNVWEHRDAHRQAQLFCERFGIEGDVLVDEDGSFAERAGVSGVPMNLLVDEEGIVRAAGATTPQELRTTLEWFLPRRR